MSYDLVTLADARDFVKSVVDGGSCDTTRIDARIDEAEQRLWVKPGLDQRMALRRVRIRTQNKCFPLPIEVDKIVWVTVDGRPAQMFNHAYEFLSSGPGDLDMRCCSSGIKDLKDEGEFPTQFDIPIILTGETGASACEYTRGGGYRLAAFSPEVSDSVATKYLTVRGWDENNDEIFTTVDGVQIRGDRVPINRWLDGTEGLVQGAWGTGVRISTADFAQVLQVYKPATAGPVSLYAVDTTTNAMYLLSKMTPEVLVPAYRRYRITNQACSDDCAVVLALVKIRRRKATAADDVMSIQNLPALKMMIRALNFEAQDNLQQAVAFEANATRMLQEEKDDRELAAGPPAMLNVMYEASQGAANRGYLV